MLQLTLPYWEQKLSNKTCRAVGIYGEEIARLILERAGYQVVTARRGEQRGDLIAIQPETGQSWRIEVKTARQGKDRKWRFTLQKDGKTNHNHADLVMLLPALRIGVVVPFIIPVANIRERRHIVITSYPSTYGGQFAPYRVRGRIDLEACCHADSQPA